MVVFGQNSDLGIIGILEILEEFPVELISKKYPRICKIQSFERRNRKFHRLELI